MHRSDDLAHRPLGVALGPIAAVPLLSSPAGHRVAVELDDDRVAVAALDDTASHDADTSSMKTIRL